jgi:hypothetical protein
MRDATIQVTKGGLRDQRSITQHDIGLAISYAIASLNNVWPSLSNMKGWRIESIDRRVIAVTYICYTPSCRNTVYRITRIAIAWGAQFGSVDCPSVSEQPEPLKADKAVILWERSGRSDVSIYMYTYVRIKKLFQIWTFDWRLNACRQFTLRVHL